MSRRTYWVNFHVGELESASTIFSVIYEGEATPTLQSQWDKKARSGELRRGSRQSKCRGRLSMQWRGERVLRR